MEIAISGGLSLLGGTKLKTGLNLVLILLHEPITTFSGCLRVKDDHLFGLDHRVVFSLELKMTLDGLSLKFFLGSAQNLALHIITIDD